MDGFMGWLVLILVLMWVVSLMYQGFKDETAPLLTLADNGQGMKEPICPSCHTRLVTVTRRTHNPITGLLSWGFVLGGVVVLLLVNWLAGLLTILLGVVINGAGKGNETVLQCPTCRKDVRRLT